MKQTKKFKQTHLASTPNIPRENQLQRHFQGFAYITGILSLSLLYFNLSVSNLIFRHDIKAFIFVFIDRICCKGLKKPIK